MPIVTHAHGAVGVGDESDGYAEAWYLPAADNIPAGFATEGTWYDFFAGKAAANVRGDVGPGIRHLPVPELAAGRRPTWYHDHTLGMTRLNVYAGPAGFFIIRGGPAGDDAVLDSRTGSAGVAARAGARENDKFPPNKPYREIPIAIQDRSFNADGSLFYPDTRAFFDGITGPYIPDTDVSPIWNPEFFGNMIIVNGNTWPFLTVEQRRYRFRVLNGCQSRFLILDFNQIPGVEVWAIGNEGGFLAAPVNLTAEQRQPAADGPRRAGRPDRRLHQRAAWATTCSATSDPTNRSEAASPGDDFDPADPDTHRPDHAVPGRAAVDVDTSTPPRFLQLPAITPLPPETVTRPLALLEEMSAFFDDAPPRPCSAPSPATRTSPPASGPSACGWTRSPRTRPSGTTEVWEFYNATADAHPMHIHEVPFEVVNRQEIVVDEDSRGAGRARIGPDPAGVVGDRLSRTPSSPTPAKSPGSRPVRHARASSSGTATSSNTKTTR